MAKRRQRPIDVKDVVWSHIGKDELDKAAESVWEALRNGGVIFEYGSINEAYPYHVLSSNDQATVQRAVITVLGTTVPTLLRDFIDYEDMPKDAKRALRELAEELEEEHGV